MSSKHFILTIGGGCSGSSLRRLWRKHVPEYCEWREVTKVKPLLIQGGRTSQVTTKTIFGGPNTTSLRTFNGLISYWFERCINPYLPSKDQTHQHPKYLTIPGTQKAYMPATQEHIQQGLDQMIQELTQKYPHSQDRATIVISGHGSPYGVVLWNNWITRHFLHKIALKQAIDQLPPQVQVTLIVNSCYSGQFLDLTSSRTTVFTSSDSTHPSMYQMMGESWVIQTRWLTPQQLTDFHFKGNSVGLSNFRASHSLDWWLDQELRKLIGSHPKWIEIRLLLDQLAPLRSHPICANFYELMILSLIILDSTGIISKFIYLKFGAGLLKTSVPFVKFATALLKSVTPFLKFFLLLRVFNTKIINRLYRQFPAFKVWRDQRFVRRDVRLLKSLRQYYNGVIDPKRPDYDVLNQWSWLLTELQRNSVRDQNQSEIVSINRLTTQKLIWYLQASLMDKSLSNLELCQKHQELWLIAQNITQNKSHNFQPYQMRLNV